MYLSYRDIEKIADTVMHDFNAEFYGNTAEAKEPHPTPIEQLAVDYLNLTVKAERLCSDGSICGITAYSETELETSIYGYMVRIPVRQNEVFLDISFFQPGNIQRLCGKRRFTLAHECAHQLLYHMEPDEGKASCRRMYADKKSYTARELKTKEDWNEWQANALGAALIMPRRDVSLLVEPLLRGRKISLYFDECTEQDAAIIQYVSGFFHTSIKAAKIRLERLGYLKDLTVDILSEREMEAMSI